MEERNDQLVMQNSSMENQQTNEDLQAQFPRGQPAPQGEFGKSNRPLPPNNHMGLAFALGSLSLIDLKAVS